MPGKSRSDLLFYSFIKSGSVLIVLTFHIFRIFHKRLDLFN